MTTKRYTADGAITTRRLVKRGASDTQMAQASAVTDLIVGVYLGPGDAANGDTIDVCLLGECTLEVTGSVSFGSLLTTDSNGKGAVAAPASGVNNRIAAMALQAGTNTTVRVLVLPGMVQGA